MQCFKQRLGQAYYSPTHTTDSDIRLNIHRSCLLYISNTLTIQHLKRNDFHTLHDFDLNYNARGSSPPQRVISWGKKLSG